jgi:hypothetical protein
MPMKSVQNKIARGNLKYQHFLGRFCFARPLRDGERWSETGFRPAAAQNGFC